MRRTRCSASFFEPRSVSKTSQRNTLEYQNAGETLGLFDVTSRASVQADGAVRFISDAVDLAVWKALSTRAGGESATIE